jgi:hypothetical protein
MNKKEIRYDKLENKAEQVALIMHRLNNMWSFTGSQLSYACDNYMRPQGLADIDERVHILLQAYAALTKSVTFYLSQGYELPLFWDSTFAKLGQDIVYTLPEMLHVKKEKAFYKNLQRGFAHAWGESPLPPSRDTVRGK